MQIIFFKLIPSSTLISGAPVNQKNTNNPFWTPKGDLPVFRHGDVVLTDFSSVSKYLLSCKYSADYNLAAKQIAEANAFVNLMNEALLPALKYVMWVDSKNHIEMTRPWFGKHLPFPLGLYYPNKYEKDAAKLVESLHGDGQNEHLEIGNNSEVETRIYKSAQECITILSNRQVYYSYLFEVNHHHSAISRSCILKKITKNGLNTVR